MKRQHSELLKQGITTWNQWRKDNPDIQPNLSEVDIKQIDLSGADLSNANLWGARFSGVHTRRAHLSKAPLMKVNRKWTSLRGANLSNSDLRGAHLSSLDLSGANLGGAKLWGADLSKTDLSGTNLKGADLREADLRDANLLGADLSNAVLIGANLIRSNLSNATLTNCRIYGISVWDVKLQGATQENLVITPDDEPTITVDDLEVAQFIYLLLEHKKLRNVLDSVIERGVLILGRFGEGGLELLQIIAAKLREMEYLPIIFDFEKPESRDFTETVITLAGLSRFVIADLSGPSVPDELRATIPNFKIPFVPIIETGRKIYSLFPELFGYPWVLSLVEFNTEEHLKELLPSRVIAPAEEKFKERRALLKQWFNR